MNKSTPPIWLGYVALIVSPAFFSTNLIFGKWGSDIAPFTLAFLRWFFSALILMILSKRYWEQMIAIAKAKWRLLILLGFLGMFICGGVVYLALHTTSATNGVLIYTTPPVFVLLMERLFNGRLIAPREIAGVILALIGVVVIVTKGSIQNLLHLSFTAGDLYFLAAAISWSIYLVFLKDETLSSLNTMPLFALIACFGALTLLPMSAYEVFTNMPLPSTHLHWSIITGIVLFSSLIAFSTFQYGVKAIGASLASIFMYLLPPFGVGLAWWLLAEKFLEFHMIGIITILGGVILATFPKNLLS